jgi:hypothetical protein
MFMRPNGSWRTQRIRAVLLWPFLDIRWVVTFVQIDFAEVVHLAILLVKSIIFVGEWASGLAATRFR